VAQGDGPVFKPQYCKKKKKKDAEELLAWKQSEESVSGKMISPEDRNQIPERKCVLAESKNEVKFTLLTIELGSVLTNKCFLSCDSSS
jgi:hypothetical protein